jgi:hypothetical protein
VYEETHPRREDLTIQALLGSLAGLRREEDRLRRLLLEILDRVDAAHRGVLTARGTTLRGLCGGSGGGCLDLCLGRLVLGELHVVAHDLLHRRGLRLLADHAVLDERVLEVAPEVDRQLDVLLHDLLMCRRPQAVPSRDQDAVQRLERRRRLPDLHQVLRLPQRILRLREVTRHGCRRQRRPENNASVSHGHSQQSSSSPWIARSAGLRGISLVGRAAAVPPTQRRASDRRVSTAYRVQRQGASVMVRTGEGPMHSAQRPAG